MKPAVAALNESLTDALKWLGQQLGQWMVSPWLNFFRISFRREQWNGKSMRIYQLIWSYWFGIYRIWWSNSLWLKMTMCSRVKSFGNRESSLAMLNCPLGMRCFKNYTGYRVDIEANMSLSVWPSRIGGRLGNDSASPLGIECHNVWFKTSFPSQIWSDPWDPTVPLILDKVICNAGFPRNDAYHLKKKKTGLPEGNLWLVVSIMSISSAKWNQMIQYIPGAILEGSISLRTLEFIESLSWYWCREIWVKTLMSEAVSGQNGGDLARRAQFLGRV